MQESNSSLPLLRIPVAASIANAALYPSAGKRYGAAGGAGGLGGPTVVGVEVLRRQIVGYPTWSVPVLGIAVARRVERYDILQFCEEAVVHEVGTLRDIAQRLHLEGSAEIIDVDARRSRRRRAFGAAQSEIEERWIGVVGDGRIAWNTFDEVAAVGKRRIGGVVARDIHLVAASAVAALWVQKEV